MTIKELNEYEHDVVELLRVELELCDLREKDTPTSEMKRLVENMRSIVRVRSEVWFDIIAMLRQKERIKHLRGKAKEEARVKHEQESDRMNRKWEEYNRRWDNKKASGAGARASSSAAAATPIG